VLDIEETLDYSNILTEQLSSPRNEEERESTNPIRDTIYVQPRPINQQGRTQQKDARALVTPEATPESEEVTQGQSLTN
jgi:hypothetical protein